MGELRKDYILDRWVIISTERAKRPHEFVNKKAEEEVGTCYFCPGNENLTPPEISRWPCGSSQWKVRVFPNKFAAVNIDGNSAIKTDNRFYTFSSNFGKHEVIVETPDHKKQLADLDDETIKEVLKMYSNRIEELSKFPGIKYVCVFKNSGKEAGTSIFHSHSQVIAYNQVPEVVNEEIIAAANFSSCPFCDIIKTEKESLRRCFENDQFVAFAPYASRFPFEIWVMPKQHIKSITEMDEGKLYDLALIMGKILRKLKELNAPYNYVLHYSPSHCNLHFHIEILPRLSTWAGFEFNGTVINVVTPEDAAKFYRGEL